MSYCFSFCEFHVDELLILLLVCLDDAVGCVESKFACSAEGGDGFVGFALLDEDNAFVVMCFGKVWIECDSGVEVFYGGVVVGQCHFGYAFVVVCFGEVGVV